MINFDRVAEVYDATRGLPDEVAERVADALIAATNATPEMRFLELGVGTGRVALPLVRRGYRFTGVDISEQMMERFREKAGNPEHLTLIQGDITQLPLEDGSQDMVLVIHVFHLVEAWRKALDEAKRVTVPDGYFVFGGNDSAPEDPGTRLRVQWAAFVRELGGTMRPRYATWEDIQDAVMDQGGHTASYRAARWPRSFVPMDVINAMHGRTFSASFDVSTEVLDAVHERMLEWGRQEFGDLERAVESHQEFILFVSRWGGEKSARS